MHGDRYLGRWRVVALTIVALGGIAHAQEKPLRGAPSGQGVAAQREPAEKKLRADVAAFRARVETALAEPRVARGHWGILVVDAATGETLYALNPDQYFTPASVTKLFTTALALATLGPDYRFRTTIETRGRVERSGRLLGDLALVGRGDPNLSNLKLPFTKEDDREGSRDKVLAELADAVVARGVRQIDGDVIADDTWLPYDRYPVGWTIGDTTWRHGAPVSALAVNDNTVVLELRPGERVGDPAWFDFDPWAGYFEVQNEIVTGPKGSKPDLGMRREPGSRRMRIWGSLPLDAKPETLIVALEDPAEHAALVLKRLLEARGVRVHGEARARHLSRAEPRDALVAAPARPPEPAGDAPTVLAEHLSLPLVESVRVVNKISRNLHAELLLRAAAREKGAGASAEDAAIFALEFFKSIGIAEDEVSLADASGLTRQNLATPRAVVKLLGWILRQPWADAFVSTLAVAGQDGTLEERMKNSTAAGRIRGKTGTLENGNGLAGIAETRHGARLLFVIFGSTHTLRGADATAPIDAICAAMVEELGAPPPATKQKR